MQEDFNATTATTDVQAIVELTTTIISAIHSSGLDKDVADLVLALLHKKRSTPATSNVTMTVPSTVSVAAPAKNE